MPAPTQANIQENRPESVSFQAALLGVLLGASLTLAPRLTFYPFALYVAALSVFHFLEYYVTARYNSAKVTSDLFLINHSGAYTAAHATAVLETLVELAVCPAFKLRYLWISSVGLMLLVTGQVLRSLAMKTAGESFSHVIATEHDKTSHKLVTGGVYGVSRHPSYTGYYWWALGSQIMLVNPVCIVVFAVVLFRFFRNRIRYEERYLVAFFGNDYVRYREKKGVFIPFIK